MNGTPGSGDGTRPRRGGKPAEGQPVIDRAFALLGTFDADHRAQTLAGLARRSKIPRSSALRLARSLVHAGALEHLDDGRYVVGLRLLETASLAPRGHGLRSVAMPFMEDLFHVTRQHVLLAVYEQGEAVLVERLSALDAGPVHYRVGGRLPLTTTGVGLVLLAFAPKDVQDHAITTYEPGEGRLRQGHDDIRTPADLRRALAEVRRGDHASGRQSLPWPVDTVAAPVRSGGEVVAALSVVAPSTGLAEAGYGPAVRATARAISRRLEEDGPWAARPGSPRAAS
ncbi:IclR family transcriptional regulator [Streptomyces sp. NBC_00102]|uniref:IclR family transcriptional regulator n=1 Tax=Streptomyces sp. NBC_00102 TaxID=2975652 RepID=UPI0022554394|nr:IclR family transcriptional regulator [Streptomyces sp. NBC_00102]MCX5402033.1 IclR family transcriptional regulator [Streptomyces sp. NBC_00102]